MVETRSVLVVDDDQRLTDCLALFLRRQGFSVATAQNGLRGYDNFFLSPSEWIITDIEMPQLNGLEMVRLIRAIDSSAKVIYTTASADRYRTQLDADARRFNAQILSKPFGLSKLIELLADPPLRWSRSASL
jgi:CheY-like chemotaxis protein